MSAMFREAAAFLAGSSGDDDAKVRAFVQRMGFDAALQSGSTSVEHTVALLEVAARMPRIFELGSPDAPAFCCIGGTVDPAAYGLTGFDTSNVSGRGATAHQAFGSCVGEGIEYLSQLEWGDEPHADVDGAARDRRLAPFSALLQAVVPDRPVAWMTARTLPDRAPTAVPADLCIRRREEPAPRGFGTGCAAGETLEQAATSALLELVERDAVALWWVGGRRGRALSAATAHRVATFLDGLRAGAAPGRNTWLLDITTDLGIPCVVAASADAAGRGLVCGMAARLTPEAAANAAVLELCQMEMSRHLVLLKLCREGEAALADTERRQLRRMTEIDATQCALLHPCADAPAVQYCAASGSTSLDILAGHLARQGVDCAVVDLTRRELRVPVARVLVPQLQPLPVIARSRRLGEAIARTGGGFNYSGAIEIM
jgi:ribosomal protein S12 methylthiotransferase accessory factor